MQTGFKYYRRSYWMVFRVISSLIILSACSTNKDINKYSKAVDSISVIKSSSDFKHSFDSVSTKLTDSAYKRITLIQYAYDSTSQKEFKKSETIIEKGKLFKEVDNTISMSSSISNSNSDSTSVITEENSKIKSVKRVNTIWMWCLIGLLTVAIVIISNWNKILDKLKIK